MGRKFLFVLFIILIVNISNATILDNIWVVDDTILNLKSFDGSIADSFLTISPSGNIITWKKGEKTDKVANLYIQNLTNNSPLNIPTKNISSVPLFVWSSDCGRVYHDTQWNVSFSSDEGKIYYSSGKKLLSLTFSDGKESPLVDITTEKEDEFKNILSADMMPDGSKCVYVVGSASKALTEGIYVYQEKTKKSIKITSAKGVSALWTSDGKGIVFERIGDNCSGEVWLLDSTMTLKRIPVGGISDKEYVMGQSTNANNPDEIPGHYIGEYSTGTTNIKMVGDTLLVIRNFADDEVNKRWIGKSYAFTVDMKTLIATRIDYLPEKVYCIAAIDVMKPGILAVYALGVENTSGIYAVDINEKQSKLLHTVDGNPQSLQFFLKPMLSVRNGAIYTNFGPKIHKLLLGDKEVKSNIDIIEPINKNEKQYIVHSKNVDSDNPDIIKLAKTITHGLKTDLEKTRAIHDWVADNMSYDEDGFIKGLMGECKSGTASETLTARKGVCWHFALLTAALHRSIGIPAKIVTGWTTTWNGSWDTTKPLLVPGSFLGHAWNEIKVDGNWIIIDTTWDSKSKYNGDVEVISHEYFNPDPYFFAHDHMKVKESND